MDDKFINRAKQIERELTRRLSGITWHIDAKVVDRWDIQFIVNASIILNGIEYKASYLSQSFEDRKDDYHYEMIMNNDMYISFLLDKLSHKLYKAILLKSDMTITKQTTLKCNHCGEEDD